MVDKEIRFHPELTDLLPRLPALRKLVNYKWEEIVKSSRQIETNIWPKYTIVWEYVSGGRSTSYGFTMDLLNLPTSFIDPNIIQSALRYLLQLNSGMANRPPRFIQGVIQRWVAY